MTSIDSSIDSSSANPFSPVSPSNGHGNGHSNGSTNGDAARRTSPVSDMRLFAEFERLRHQLLYDDCDDRLLRPLAYWALPSDRRLPRVFLSRPLKDLLSMSFRDLTSTPGVGQKKVHTMLVLFGRAIQESSSNGNGNGNGHGHGNGNGHPHGHSGGQAVEFQDLDPDEVSEGTWAQWQECVIRTGCDDLPLGRFAPSLNRLPRVLWSAPLSKYTHRTLSEIRALKTHGEKRVAVLIEVFGSLYRILHTMEPQPEVAVSIMPRIASDLKDWVESVRRRNVVPSDHEVRHRFLRPLMVQARLDGGSTMVRLIERRLGMTDASNSVRLIADDLGLTRARVYQRLQDAAEMMRVRWPDGQRELYALRGQIRCHHEATSAGLALFEATVDIFFPLKLNGA